MMLLDNLRTSNYWYLSIYLTFCDLKTEREVHCYVNIYDFFVIQLGVIAHVWIKFNRLLKEGKKWLDAWGYLITDKSQRNNRNLTNKDIESRDKLIFNFWRGARWTIFKKKSCKANNSKQNRARSKGGGGGGEEGKIEQVPYTIQVLCLTLKKSCTSHCPSKNPYTT